MCFLLCEKALIAVSVVQGVVGVTEADGVADTMGVVETSEGEFKGDVGTLGAVGVSETASVGQEPKQ